MKIEMVLQAADPGDEDAASSTGLTQEAYDRLYNAVADAGFDWVSGPDRVWP